MVRLKQRGIRRILIIGIASILLAGTGTVFGMSAVGSGPNDDREDMAPVQIASTLSTTSIATTTTARPTTDDPDSLLQAVLLRTGAQIVGASLGAPPLDTAGVEQENVGDPRQPATGQTLYVTFDAADAPGTAVKGVWLANLIGGALTDDLRANGYARLVSIVYLARRTTGETVEIGAGIGNMAPQQQFSLESAEQLASRTRAGAEALGLTVVSVDVYAPMQRAPALTVRSSDVERYIHGTDSAPRLLDMIFGETTNLEGFYLELQTTEGTPVMKIAAANRAGTGQTWLAPPYQDSLLVGKAPR